jgi:hypothetical protein
MRLQISRLQADAIAPRAGNPQLVVYSRAFQCGQALLSPTRRGLRQRLDCIVAALDVVEVEVSRSRRNPDGACERHAQICVISEASDANFNGALQLFVICRPAI